MCQILEMYDAVRLLHLLEIDIVWIKEDLCVAERILFPGLRSRSVTVNTPYTRIEVGIMKYEVGVRASL